MARYRTIKPEFWTAERVMECSLVARLLFIGIWNFCDDGGNHPVSHKTLKAEVFPADNISAETIADLIGELIRNGLVIEYTVEDNRYWHVTGWHHQKIDQPTYRYPLPNGAVPEGPAKRRQQNLANFHKVHSEISPNVRGVFTEQSPNVRGMLAECSPPENSGVEKKDIEAYASVDGKPPTTPATMVQSPCPADDIIALYHELMPLNPVVKVLNIARRKTIRARWKEAATLNCKPFGYSNREEGLKAWRTFFEVCADSPFLTGKAPPQHGKPPFIADIDFLMSPAGFVKCLENKYHREVE